MAIIFAQHPLTLLMGLITCILCILSSILLLNLTTFQRLRTTASTLTPLPFVSILVPARNEENCIEECIRSLVQQDYEPREIVVLDDQSSDRTRAIVQQIADELPATQRERLRILAGQPLPAGWIGKNFACYQLSQAARGEYLIFTDADTVHQPAMTRSVIGCMQEFGVQLLTAQPEHTMKSLGERLVVPLLNFTILTLLPIPLILHSRAPSLATGNGQLLCFQRSAYERIGGHTKVKGRILEDVLLARAIKAAGYRMIFVDALEFVRCRMYHSFAEVWSGFSKNLFAFYNYSLPFAILSLILNLGLFLLPLCFLIAALFISLPSQALLFAAIGWMITICMRILLTLRFCHQQRSLMLLISLLHSVSILLECLILLNSIRWHYRKAGTTWKGRQYSA